MSLRVQCNLSPYQYELIKEFHSSAFKCCQYESIQWRYLCLQHPRSMSLEDQIWIDMALLKLLSNRDIVSDCEHNVSSCKSDY